MSLTLLVCSRSLFHVYSSVSVDYFIGVDHTHHDVAPSSNPHQRNHPQSPETKRDPKFAYAFLLGGLPSPSDGTTGPALGNENTIPPPKNAYKGLVYNILVSIQILKDAGSKADFVLLVHMASSSHTATLPEDVTRWFSELGVHIKYLPPTPSWVNEFSTIAMEKFRILDFVEYDRVLFLEADVMPYCNLDYLFELSMGTGTPTLQPNLILSIDNTPASSTFFMLQPGVGHFQSFLDILAKWPQGWNSFYQSKGWGMSMTGTQTAMSSSSDAATAEDEITTEDLAGSGWRSLNGQSGDSWSFEGAESDQGLLLHWSKFVVGNVSIVIGDQMETYVKGKLVQTLRDNPLQSHSCLGKIEKESQGIGKQWFPNKGLQAQVSPKGVAPYKDFAQWRYNPNRPWHYPKAPPQANSTKYVKTARKFWFHILRQLDLNLKMGLGFDPNVVTDPAELFLPEKYDAFKEANWKYVAQRRHKDLNPIWSTKVQSLQQWALRIVNSTLISFPWEAPTLYEIPTPTTEDTRDTLSSAPAAEGGRCQCPKLISTDPCTSATGPSLEDWLGQKVPYYLSKQRPLCPNAAKHHIRIVVPVGPTSGETGEGWLRKTMCSIACQDYPPDKVSVLFYSDGSSSENTKTAMEGICGKVIVYQPLSADSSLGGAADFDHAARKHAADAVKEYTSSPSVSPSRICVQAQDRTGPAGSKYWAFRLMEAMSEANDIVVVVEGGDELKTRKAFHTINRLYIENNAWMTYGAATSSNNKLGEIPGPIPESIVNGTDPFLPRQHEPMWRYGHPRSFKAHLLREIGQQDFTSADRAWLQNPKPSERGFVYRILELAGADRVAYTPKPIYKVSNVQEQSNGDDPDGTLQHILAMKPSQRLDLPIHIVLVSWDRTVLLPEQLISIQEQLIAQTRQLHVHLVNNNPEKNEEIDTIANGFLQNQAGVGLNSTSVVPLKITVVHNKENWHAFSRFLYVQELRRQEALDSVIFVDDDQYWAPTFVESLLALQRPQGMVTWYGKTFATRDQQTGLADYWKPTMSWTDILLDRKPEIRTFTYAGPGGSLINANFWLMKGQLNRLTGDMKQYYEFDDVWISYIMDALLGWEIHRLDAPLPVDIAICNRTHFNETVFPHLPPGKAEKLLELQQKVGQQLQSVATFTGSSREIKTKMFEELQVKFHWNVLRPGTPPLRKSQRPELVLPSTTRRSTPARRKDGDKRAFICVTGQFDRFELQNKIDFIFKPLQNAGYKTDAALVLSSGEVLFTNAKKNNIENKFMPFYTNFSQAVQDLENNNIRLITASSTSVWNNGTYPRLEDLPIYEKYVNLIYESQKDLRGARSYEEQMERAGNHGRIFDSYVKCLEHADEAARQAGAAGGDSTRYYDVFIRIRDDSGMNRPLNVMGVSPATGGLSTVLTDAIPPPPNSIIVTECRSWGGMNDRFAIVAPDIARRYFLRPYDVLANERFIDDKVVRNPETLLLNIYAMSKIHVLGHPDLKRVNRVVKHQLDGKVAFYTGDKYQAGCPRPYTHLQRNYDLYGWVL